MNTTTTVFDRPLLLISEVAARLRVTEHTVRRLIATGQLRAVRWNGNLRVEPEELEAFEARHTTTATLPAMERKMPARATTDAVQRVQAARSQRKMDQL